MKSVPPHRIAAILALSCVFTPPQQAWSLGKQDEPSAKAVLLGRARTLEQRGRLDLAKQDWVQVLQTDPTEAEALAGLVRAARAEGRTADADGYLARLRAAHPNGPELARLQGGGTKAHDVSAQAELDEAARLARGGDARGAMTLYRKVYGMNPPQGAPALAYYGTEAATEEGRPHAIAGLRALSDRFPTDARYRVALGKILLSSARTRAEGRTILEELPGNPEAVAALRLPQGGDEHGAAAANAAARATETAAAAPIPHAPVSKAPDAAAQPTTQPAALTAASHPPVVHTTLTAGSSAGHHLTFAVEEQAAYSALNQHKTAEAEQRFREILAKDPRDARALAGMGYLRTTNGDYRSAVKLFEQAQESGDRSLALTRAMVNAQFELALQEAGSERARGNLGTAEDRYRAALRERPSDSEALDGLGSVLLQEWRPADAIAVYDRLTHVRPMSPAAWRGLVVAEASAGRSAAALATDAQVPTAAKTPLLQDQTYLRAVGVARGSQGTQVARAEAPPILKASPVTTAKMPSSPPVSAPGPGPAASSPQPVDRGTKTAAASRGGEVSRGHGNKPSAAAVAPAPPPAPAVRPPAAPKPEAPSGVATPGELEQANAALLRGNNAEAATMFRSIAGKAPQRADGWRGLVLALHNEGHEIEALAALERMPSEAKLVLDRDASFQSAAGAVYLTTNQPNEALRSYARAQDVFSGQRLPPPLELVLQTARLLAARGDDENLYRELMYLGERMDATDSRRAEVQMIWTRWAIRRARAVAAAGEERRAVTLLNAAAAAFTGNPEVLRAVADGYAGVGRPREAVALYKTQDLATAPVGAIEAAVSAATAARDFRTAENWTRLGLQRFGQDPGMLTTAAELAQARGHEKQAVALSQQAKGLAPAQNPGQVLAAELKQANAGHGWSDRPASGGQLSVLLAPREAAAMASGAQATHPYLPTSAERTTGTYTPTATVEPPVLTGYDEPSR